METTMSTAATEQPAVGMVRQALVVTQDLSHEVRMVVEMRHDGVLMMRGHWRHLTCNVWRPIPDLQIKRITLGCALGLCGAGSEILPNAQVIAGFLQAGADKNQLHMVTGCEE